MCTVRRSRGIAQPVPALACGRRAREGAFAHIESFALVLEEHVCTPLAMAKPALRVHLHSATTPRAAVAPPVPYVRDMVGKRRRGDGWKWWRAWLAVGAAQATSDACE